MGQNQSDKTLILVTLTLLMIGVVMIYSASAVLAGRQYGDSLYFIKRQLLWAMIGLMAMGVMSRIPYSIWQGAALPLIFGAVVLLGGPVLYTC